MEAFFILLRQTAMIGIYMLAGAILIKTHVLTEQTLDPISKYVLRLALPMVVFTNTIKGVTREILFRSLNVLLFSLLMFLLLGVMGYGLRRAFGLQYDRGRIFQALVTFGNVGFMGIPIISSIFPERGMLYFSLFSIIDQLALWTFGVLLTTPTGGKKQKFNPRRLINPATAAIALALLLILIGIQLPDVLVSAFTNLGSTATPLALVYLGGVFACMDIRKYLPEKGYYIIIALKMLCFPILFFLLLGLFPINPEIRVTLAVLSGMPCMSSIAMMAKSSGSDGDYAVGGIFVTTIASLATLPLIYSLMQLLP